MSTIVSTSLGVAPRTCLIEPYALARIEYRVRRLTAAFHLDEAAAEDLHQDMLAQLLRAGRRYDARKSRRRTFITRVLDRHYLHVARTLSNRRRHEALCPVALSALEDFCPTVNDTRSGERSECARVDLALDVAAVVSRLPASFAAHLPGVA